MGSSQRKKNESFFKSASAPAFLRYYSIFNMIKISGIVTFLYFMAFNQKNVILNAYPNFSACSKCLSAAVAGQQTSNWYEFGYCDQTFFAPGSSSTGTPKAAQTSFNSVKDVNLLLNRGNMVWKRSLVLQYPIIVYSIVGLAGLAVLSLLYYTSAYGKLRLQDQGPLVALNIFVCSLLSVLMMWFFNTMYGYNKLNNCYVTSFNPTMSMISFIAADALIFLGSVWFLTAHTRFKKNEQHPCLAHFSVVRHFQYL